jgi:hypothetical protein
VEELKRPLDITSGLPGSKLLSSKIAPSAPVFADLHWRAKVANQNCCSIKGTKTLLRLGHTEATHPVSASAFPNAFLYVQS